MPHTVQDYAVQWLVTCYYLWFYNSPHSRIPVSCKNENELGPQEGWLQCGRGVELESGLLATMWRGRGAGEWSKTNLRPRRLGNCAEPLVPLGYCGFCTMMCSYMNFCSTQSLPPPLGWLSSMMLFILKCSIHFKAQCDLSASVKPCPELYWLNGNNHSYIQDPSGLVTGDTVMAALRWRSGPGPRVPPGTGGLPQTN